MKRILSVLLILAPIAAICYICGSIGWGFFDFLVWTPFEMKQALKPYDGATYLFEETDPILTHTDQTTVYYWSADPLEKVKGSYEKTGLKFLPGTNQLDW